jgi:hypothetical protein
LAFIEGAAFDERDSPSSADWPAAADAAIRCILADELGDTLEEA